MVETNRTAATNSAPLPIDGTDPDVVVVKLASFLDATKRRAMAEIGAEPPDGPITDAEYASAMFRHLEARRSLKKAQAAMRRTADAAPVTMRTVKQRKPRRERPSLDELHEALEFVWIVAGNNKLRGSVVQAVANRLGVHHETPPHPDSVSRWVKELRSKNDERSREAVDWWDRLLKKSPRPKTVPIDERRDAS